MVHTTARSRAQDLVSDVADISAGTGAVAALKRNGTILAWGKRLEYRVEDFEVLVNDQELVGGEQQSWWRGVQGES